MSSLFWDSPSRSSRAAYRCQVWGEFFGGLIGAARQERGLSIEDMARRTGMPESEWNAIEAGTLPQTREELQAIAAGLDIEWEDMVPFIWFCREAWARRPRRQRPFPGPPHS
jgi:transcriptional regulator with XRE-family HTH domain